MRPGGEIREAILQAATDLSFEIEGRRRGPTVKELAARAQVASTLALYTVKNLTRAGRLVKVAQRKVDYRNKPVNEYAPSVNDAAVVSASDDVARVMSLWAQRG